VSVVLATGCHSYVPVEPAAVPPGEEVRFELLPQGPRLPNQTTTQVTGLLIGADEADLLVSVPAAIVRDGATLRTLRQEVRFSVDQVARFEQRRLDRARTGVTVLATLALLGVVYNSFGQDRPVGSQPETPIDLEAGAFTAAIRLLSIPWGGF